MRACVRVCARAHICVCVCVCARVSCLYFLFSSGGGGVWGGRDTNFWICAGMPTNRFLSDLGKFMLKGLLIDYYGHMAALNQCDSS